MFRLVILMLSALLLAAPAVEAGREAKVSIGDVPPDYLGQDENGDDILASGQRGKVVVVTFWATWCGPCLRSLPSLDRLATERAAAGVEVWAVNVDDASAARALFDRAGYRLPLLADDGDTSARFGVNALPHTVVVDRRGRVVEVHRGNDPAGIRAAVDAAQ